MKLSVKIAFLVAAVSAVSAVTAVIVYKTRKERCTNMLTQVSDQGYETAHDILFPGSRKGGPRLHYGPVLPHDEA